MPNPTPQQRPNLLFIYSDQHCPAVAGCYGDPIVQTPNLDRLAARGVVFDSAYCPSPLCVPSRMAFLTGRHPCEIEVWTNDHVLDAGIPTLAHALGAGGYRPVLVGRMHAIGPDQLHGYVERLVGDHGPNHLGGSPVDHGILQGTAGPFRISLEKSGPGQSAYQVHDEYVTAAAVDAIRRAGLARRSGVSQEPLDLSVGFMLPHQPFVARREDYERYLGRVGLPQHPEPYSEKLHPHLRYWRALSGIEELSEAEALRARTAYWALVDRMDAMIGEILQALGESGLEENTLIAYTSDHGEQLGEHGLWWKQTFYEHSARVPMILSWPGVLPQGVRCSRVVSQYDLNATLLAGLGAPELPNSHGRNLLPLLQEPGTPWDDIAISEYCTDEGAQQRMVRRDAWKLVYYHGQEPQLFNLAEDPHELADRAADPACRRVREELRREALRGWNPDAIVHTMRQKRADTLLLTGWARQTRPPDQYRWKLLPEMDYLD
jgi:choline-sulfatase